MSDKSPSLWERLRHWFRYRKCKTCKGNGGWMIQVNDMYRAVDCQKCKGSGFVKRWPRLV